MKFNAKKFFGLLYEQMKYDSIPSRAAEISFYLLLSFFPFLIFIITLISYIPIIHLNPYINLFSNIMPSNANNIVNYIMKKAINDKSSKLLLISATITLWSATNGITAIIRGINKAYDEQETRSYLKIKLISQIFTLEIVLMITFSFVLIVCGNKLGLFIAQNFMLNNRFLLLWNSFRYIVDVLSMILIFISLFKYTPNKAINISEVIPGVLLSTIGWIIFSVLFSFYANHFINYNLLYGSIGGIIALLSWIYLSSMMILLGAEVNASLYFMITGKKKEKGNRY